MTESAQILARAKELYALSNQGPWEALAEWMQLFWIEAAKDNPK